MGTLSGGGTEQITIGERCLLGANAGIGISLGDDCVVEAGLYVTAGTPVLTARRRWSRPASCRDQRQPDVHPRRPDRRGRSLAPAPACWGELNAALHAKQYRQNVRRVCPRRTFSQR